MIYAQSPPGFWQGPVAGSLVTGIVAITVAVVTLLATQRTTSRQLAAARDSWRRDQILKQLIQYLSTAKIVADHAFYAGTMQAGVLANGPRGSSDPETDRTYTDDESRKYLEVLKADTAIRKARVALDVQWQKFSEQTHAAALVLGEGAEKNIAEALRRETDQLFGYAHNLDPMMSDKEVHQRFDRCKDLRIKLEKSVAALLSKERLPVRIEPMGEGSSSRVPGA